LLPSAQFALPSTVGPLWTAVNPVMAASVTVTCVLAVAWPTPLVAVTVAV
jgi:hypothetical protein